MNARLPLNGEQVGRVLLTVWRACGRGGWVGAGLLGVLLAFALAVAILPQGALGLPGGRLRSLLTALSVLGAVMAGLVVLLFWLRMVTNVLQQNDPQLARVVPGQARALRHALCGVAVLVGLVAGLVGFGLGLRPVAVFGVLTAVLAILAALAAVIRWPRWGFGLMVLSWAAPWLPSTTASGQIGRWLIANPAPACGLVLAVSLWTLSGAVMNGGPRHVSAHRRMRAMAAAMKGDFPAQAAASGNGAAGQGAVGRFGNPGLLMGKGLYSRWLRRTLQRPSGPVLPRLALGLGPPQHWTGLLSGLLVAGFFISVPLLLAWASPSGHGVRQMGMSMVAGAPLLMLAAAIGWPPALWATRREQALLRLLPGVPQGSALNRWLALHLARQFLPVVLLTAAVAVACIRRWDLDFQWAAIEDFVLSCAALSPWLLLWLWRDWSALRPPTGGWQVGFVAAVIAIAGSAWVWVGPLAGTWWALAAFSALLFVPLGRWRWRRAVQAPVAWPVGWASGGEPARTA